MLIYPELILKLFLLNVVFENLSNQRPSQPNPSREQVLSEHFQSRIFNELLAYLAPIMYAIVVVVIIVLAMLICLSKKEAIMKFCQKRNENKFDAKPINGENIEMIANQSKTFIFSSNSSQIKNSSDNSTHSSSTISEPRIKQRIGS